MTGAFEATYVPDGYTASEQIEEPVWAPLPPIVGKEDDQPDEVPATPIPGRTIHTQDFDQDAGDGIVVIHVIQGPPVLEVAEELAANPDAELFTLGSGTPAVLLPQNSESSLDQVLFAAGTFTVQVIGRNVSQELVVDMAEGVEVD